MKVSEVTRETLKTYIGYSATAQDNIIDVYMASAKAYIEGYTGLTSYEIDMHEDITFAYMCLISDMFINRQSTVDKAMSDNPTVKNILSMYAINYL